MWTKKKKSHENLITKLCSLYIDFYLGRGNEQALIKFSEFSVWLMPYLSSFVYIFIDNFYLFHFDLIYEFFFY